MHNPARLQSIRVALASAIAVFAFAGQASANVIAYQVPANTNGNQAWGGALGMDFDVNWAIQIYQLGCFDSGSNGLSGPISVRLYNRDTQTVLASLTFLAGLDGTLVGGSRFKPLAAPLQLLPGFHGRIVADGYGASEPNGNGMGGAISWTTNSDFGALSFVGRSYWGATAGIYPTNEDTGPANRYAAGTFEFAQYPEPATLTLLALGGIGLLRRRRAR